MIIVGYQGIGKSTYCANHSDAIDLESSNFFIDGKRLDGWEKMYVKIAKHLSDQGFIVFVSSHKGVRKSLLEVRNEDPKTKIYAIAPYPNENVKKIWVDKLKERWLYSGLDKDWRAYKNAENRYVENIKEIEDDIGSGCTLYLMDDNYSLDDTVGMLRLL